MNVKSAVIVAYTYKASGSKLKAKKYVASVYIFGGTDEMNKAAEKIIKSKEMEKIIRLNEKNANAASALIAKHLSAKTGKPAVLVSGKAGNDLIKAVKNTVKAVRVITFNN